MLDVSGDAEFLFFLHLQNYTVMIVPSVYVCACFDQLLRACQCNLGACVSEYVQ